MNRTREYISHVPILLPPTRLRYDYEGMRSFAKYTPQLVPKVYYYDGENHILFLQYLKSFQPLQRLFLAGQVPNDVGKILGTLMGRNHAKTFHLLIPPDQKMKYERIFANQEHQDLWKNNFFTPTLSMIETFISSLPKRKQQKQEEKDLQSEYSPLDREYRAKLATMKLTAKEVFNQYLLQYQEEDNIQTNSPSNNRIYRIIYQLQQRYLHERETLIHGDLECNNILYSFPTDNNANDDDNNDINKDISKIFPYYYTLIQQKGKEVTSERRRTVISDYDEDVIQLKIIDFEKCSYSLSGIDLGIFLVNYIWYYLAHSQSSIRKSLMNQIFTVIDCYRSAFQVQYTGTMKQIMMKRKFTTSPSTSSFTASASSQENNKEVEGINEVSMSPNNSFMNSNIDDILYNIILDSIGYAGLYLLFITITYPNEFDNIFDYYNKLLELQSFNKENRKLFIEQRRIHVIISLLMIYDQHRNYKKREEEGVGVGGGTGRYMNELLQDFQDVFSKDDDRLITDHFTEYWY
eukprot:gene10304-11206_t